MKKTPKLWIAHHNQITHVKWRVCPQIAHHTPLHETIVTSIPFSKLLSFVWALPLGFVCNFTLSFPLFLPQPLCISLWWFSCSAVSYSCNPRDCCLPVSSVHGISQARTLEWVAISFSNAWKWKVKVKSLSRVRPSATPWTAAFQAPPFMGFSRQEYWSGVPLPSLLYYVTVI